jgi:methyl-accepting chemotaxis protein
MSESEILVPLVRRALKIVLDDDPPTWEEQLLAIDKAIEATALTMTAESVAEKPKAARGKGASAKAKATIAELEGELEKAKTALATAHDELTQQKAEATALAGREQNALQRLAEQEQHVAAGVEREQSLAAQLAEQEQRAAAVEGGAAEDKQAREDLSEELKTEKKNSAELISTLKDLRDQISQQEDKQRALQKTVDEERTMALATRKAADEAERRVAAAQLEAERLATQQRQGPDDDWLDRAKALFASAQEIGPRLQRLAQGDLRLNAASDLQQQSDPADLLAAFNRTLAELGGLVGQCRTSSEHLLKEVEPVAVGSESLSATLAQQLTNTEEMSGALEKMKVDVEQSASTAAEAKEHAGTVRTDATTGTQKMQTMVKAMGQIQESNSKVAGIIRVIDEIAFQTNLLALNAAVEAARAGVHGRGFAVVAEEVRNLAGRSATAAKQTTELIERTVKDVGQGTKVAQETAQSLESMVSNVNQVSELIDQLAAANAQQVKEISHVDENLSRLRSDSQGNAGEAEQNTNALASVRSKAEAINAALGRFQLDESKVLPRPAKGGMALPPGVSLDQLKAFISRTKI